MQLLAYFSLHSVNFFLYDRAIRMPIRQLTANRSVYAFAIYASPIYSFLRVDSTIQV